MTVNTLIIGHATISLVPETTSMTEEKPAKHTPELILESVARVTKNGFVAYDSRNKITYFSEKMSEVTGWHEAEIIGRNISDLYVAKDSCNFEDKQDVCSQAVILFTKNGKQIPLETRITPVTTENDKDAGFLVFFVIEDYKKDLDQAQSEFISTVSHELRTPITSIKGFASTLLQQGNKVDEEKRKKYTKIIKDQAERLSRLVEDLLAVSRLESKKLQLTIHPVKLKPIIEDIAILVESKFNNTHRIEISCDDKVPPVWVDSDRLIQVLTNLMDNAVKYSPGKDLVEVKVRTCQFKGKEMVRVNISDYGIGIKEEDQRKVFTKFSRLDSPLTRQTEGTGLGLYISHSLAHLIGGDLKLKSEAGKTTFSLYLPIESHKGGEIWWD